MYWEDVLQVESIPYRTCGVALRVLIPGTAIVIPQWSQENEIEHVRQGHM